MFFFHVLQTIVKHLEGLTVYVLRSDYHVQYIVTRLTTIPLKRPSRYYGHFILAREKAQTIIF